MAEKLEKKEKAKNDDIEIEGMIEEIKDDPAEEIKITPVKAYSQSEGDTAKDRSSGIADPWKEEPEEGFLKDTSTWKAITGIAVVLLLLSIFTQGFQLSDENEGVMLTVSEAEEKALQYVNTNLLRAPLLAEVEHIEEAGSVYKVTLSVAGEQVDSYISKDGALFFPNGFHTDEDISSQVIVQDEAVQDEAIVQDEAPDDETERADDVQVGGAIEEAEADSVDPVDPLPSADLEGNGEGSEAEEQEVSEAEEQEVIEEPVAEQPGQAVSLSITAKKWMFSPDKLMVHQGDAVELMVVPEGLDFTLAIPDFDVEQQIVGETTVSFVADKQGTFDFICSSCEEWRGMTGRITVE